MATGGCGGRCIDNNWKMVTDDGKCCYHICDNCFSRLIGQGGGGRQGAGNPGEKGGGGGKSSKWEF